MPSPSARRFVRRGLVAVAVLGVVVGVTVAVLLLHAPGNVSHANIEFTTHTTAAALRNAPVFQWPRYGYDAGRTRFFPGAPKLVPPFRVAWHFQDYALLEFPPVVYRNRLFIMDDDASVKAIDRQTGRKLWETKVGTLAAASPALAVKQGLLFVPALSIRGGAPGHGRFVALSMRTGRIVWSYPLPAGSESSPTTWRSSVYFGDQAGHVYDLRIRDGHLNWMFTASGPVKGGPAVTRGKVYFGDYTGRAYALNAATGRRIWAANTNGANFGFGSGNFYATPAVAFGRVYMGNTDGRVYSFAQRTGQLAWAMTTGAYVYASAAVDDVRGLGPTVYIGSYDHTFYAFNARSGAIRWKHHAGGRITGSATIANGVVYYSNLDTKTTVGLNARTGRQVFSFPDGQFNGLVCDPGALYLSGSTTLYRLLPERRPARRGDSKNSADPNANGGKRRG